VLALLVASSGEAVAEQRGKDPLTQDGAPEEWEIKNSDAEPRKNLLANPGFEETEGGGPVAWRVEKGKWGEDDGSDDTTFHSGKRSVRVTCPPNGHHQTAVSAAIPVKPKGRYRLSVWSKSTGGAFTYILAWFQGRKITKEVYRFGGAVRGPHDWTKSSFLFRTTPDTERLEVRLGIKYGATAWFDDVALEEAPEGEVDNLLINSSFEYAANPGYSDAWNRRGYRYEKRFYHQPGAWGLDETTAYHGRYSLRVGAPLRTHSVWYEHVPPPCTFSLYVKANQPDLQFKMWFGNASEVFSVGTEWKRCSVTSTARSLTLYFQPIFPAGTPAEGVTWTDAGRFGKGVVYDGKTSRLYVNDRWKGEGKESMPAGTIEFWLRPARPIDKPEGNGIGLLCRDNCRPGLYINPRGGLVWSIYDGKQHSSVYTDPMSWEKGRWYHVAVTWGPGGQKAYINGELRGAKEKSTGTYETRRAGPPWKLGGREDAGLPTFEGCFDELRISSKARTPEEMSVGPEAKPYETDEHTVLLVHFDESGAIHDASRPKAPPPVFWVDAAQLEEGTEATPYRPGWRDLAVKPKKDTGPKQVTVRFSKGEREMFPAPTAASGGKPFIPVWIWGLTPEDAAALMEHGVNAALCGEETVAKATELGLKVIYATPSAWRIREDEKETGLGVPMTRDLLLRLVREQVIKHKENPSIIGWFTCDEPRPEKGLSHDLLLDMYRAVKGAGAKQPVYINCAIGHTGRWKNPEFVQEKFVGFIPATDWIGVDVYPVPRAPLDLVAWQTDVVRARAKDKVCSMVLQFFMGGRFLREPTPSELTSMWYLSLIHGARHIGLYSRKTTAHQPWARMKALASETRALTPILASAERTGLSVQTPGPHESGIHCLLRKHGGKLYLIATNAEHRTTECRFVLPDALPGPKIRVMFEDRTLTAAEGAFTDTFRPYQRHVYGVPVR